MARTVIDIDEEALAKAAAELGTSTKVSTVNEALRRIASERDRRDALARLTASAAAGELDFLQDRDALWR